jgi:hypothetical protein
VPAQGPLSDGTQIPLSNWNIADLSYAPVATTEDNGILEFSLNPSHA